MSCSRCKSERWPNFLKTFWMVRIKTLQMRNKLSETYAEFSASYNQPVVSTRKNLVIWKGSTMALLDSRNCHYQSTTQNQLGPCLWLEPLTQVLVDSSRFATRTARAQGSYVPSFEAIWASTWAKVAPKCVQVGAKLRHLGAKLGCSWSQVGPSWAEVGALLAEVGQVGPMLRPCRIETVRLDDFGPICKMCKLSQSHGLNRHLRQ